MERFEIIDELPFVTMFVFNNSKSLKLDKILLDTGSVGTVLNVDALSEIGISPKPEDKLRRIIGVGGSEFVLTKKIDGIKVGNVELKNFDLEIGAVDYGFEINGILGMDFLGKAKSKIDFEHLYISFSHD